MTLVLDSEAVKRLRLARAETQQQLAERAGISRVRLVDLEKEDKTVRPSTVQRLAAALGVQVDEISEVA